MNNFFLYKLLNFVVNKDVYAQALSESEFENELVAKNLRHFRNRIGLPEGYKTGASISGVETTRLNQSDLVPFLEDKTVTVTNGLATLADWYYINDFNTTSSRSSEIISYQEYSARFNDALLKPTTKDVVAYVVKEGLRVLPSSIKSIHAFWYRKPKDPVFKTKVDPLTLALTYDVAGSVELEWDDGSKLDILAMILAEMGINIQRTDVAQYATKLIETGK